MTPENFCYWLQGVIEVVDPQELNREQVEIIKEHLRLVFRKETKLKFGSEQLKEVLPQTKLEFTPSSTDQYGLDLDSIPICSQQLFILHNDGTKLPPPDTYKNPIIFNIPPNASC